MDGFALAKIIERTKGHLKGQRPPRKAERTSARPKDLTLGGAPLLDHRRVAAALKNAVTWEHIMNLMHVFVASTAAFLIL